MRRVFSVLLIVAVATMMSAIPAVGAGKKAPVGDQINVLVGAPTTFDAGAPFHVIHGFGHDPSESHPIGKFDFRLEIDGIDQGPGMVVDEGTGPDHFKIRRVLYNYPDGLVAGTYFFTGTWFEPCRYAVSVGDYPGPCPKPNESVPVFTASVWVTFS